MEKLMNYNEFLSEYIYKKFGPLDREILVRDLGIDNDTFCDAIKNYAKLSKKKQVAITVLISKIKNMINNEVLLRELLGRIIFICSYGKVMEVSNSFKGIYQDKNNTYSVEIHLEDNKINSYAKSNIGYSNITYEKNDDGFTIVYDSKKQSSFGNSNPVYEDITKKIIKNYDNNGRQTSEFSEKKKEDYFMDKKTGDKILTEPCVFDNYINKKYMWRDSDFILMKESEKHVFDSTDDTFIKNRDKDSFLIGIDHNPDNLEMSRSHHFFGISSGDFELYRNGLISVEDIWDYTRPRYRVMDIFHL